MKKIVMACWIILLATVLAGCSKGNGSDNGENQQPAQSPKTGDEQQGSQEGATGFEKRITFTATSVDVTENGNYTEDEIFKTLDEKFNFEYKLVPLSWDNWAERDRLWINSGDMPDMMFWDFNYTDYLNYSKQGLIKPLPDDYESKYPNLANSIKKSGIGDFLKSQDPDGRLYMVPNVIYNNPVTETTDIIIDSKVLYYRQDWAKKVGIQVGDTITMEQIAQLGKAFVEQDPGNNGAGKTIGLSSAPDQLFAAFVQPFNKHYKIFHKVDGKYVWGAFEDSTLEGVKNFEYYFKQGFMDKDFYTFKAQEHLEKFNAGISGMFVWGASAANVNERMQAFDKANPDLDSLESIGIATIVGDDGKFYGEQNLMNFWTGEIFSPTLDDETFDRILTILDYIATPEGQRLIFAGIEGKDYEMNGEELVITREKDSAGNFKYIADMYPSYYFFYTKVILPDDWSARDPSLPAAVRDRAISMFRVKEKITDVVPPDYELILLSTPNKNKFSINVVDAIVQALYSGKDIETAWEEWKLSSEPKVRDVLNEINGALIK
ncbi:extracellular solute-binding protein [Paenibacillus sp. IITD108]|uniref:extracellular solute-binding protein n=1 Tax=Paenibacillus sp. IITD108 TaxID=3116649 RepID=UPI002F408445